MRLRLALMVKMVATSDLGSDALTRVGSSPTQGIDRLLSGSGLRPHHPSTARGWWPVRAFGAVSNAETTGGGGRRHVSARAHIHG